jgi:hypothetical protein
MSVQPQPTRPGYPRGFWGTGGGESFSLRGRFIALVIQFLSLFKILCVRHTMSQWSMYATQTEDGRYDREGIDR